jgi:hypothetical protein
MAKNKNKKKNNQNINTIRVGFPKINVIRKTLSANMPTFIFLYLNILYKRKKLVNAPRNMLKHMNKKVLQKI